MAAETRPEPATGDHQPTGPTTKRPARIARNTAIFSILTGLSRIAGLVREIVASSYFGTSGAFSAFTLAFQVPNLVRNLFADAALSAAFVPVFTDLLERGRRRDAYQLASTFFVLIVAALTSVTIFFIAVAPVLMPVLSGDDFTPELDHLMVGLSQVLFPIVLLLGLNGLVVGILNAYDHFTIPALAPLVWNFVIIGLLVVLKPQFSADEELYAYAIAVVGATFVQLAMAFPVLRRLDFHFVPRVDIHDPRVKQVLVLMLPVTLSLGLINFNMLINSSLGSAVSEAAPRAIDAAFRIYMLPQGMFSVAVATVLFPALSRLANRRDYDGLRHLTCTGTRQIYLLLIPCAACTLVLPEPITRLVYERGEFDADSTALVAEALFWFSFSLPFAGANLLLTRTFFSLRRPWLPTGLGAATLVLNAAVAFALYEPFGIAGIVLATAVASAAMTFGQSSYLRRELGGSLEGRATFDAVLRILLGSALLGAVAYGLYVVLDALCGRSLAGQIVSVGGSLTAGLAAYGCAVLALRVPEAQQIRDAVVKRLRRARA